MPFLTVDIAFGIFVMAFIRLVVISVTTIATPTFGDVFSSVLFFGLIAFLLVFGTFYLKKLPVPVQIRSIAPLRL